MPDGEPGATMPGPGAGPPSGIPPEAIDGPVIVIAESALAAQGCPDLAPDWLERRLAAYERWHCPPFIDAWGSGDDCSPDLAAVSQGILRLRAILASIDVTPPAACQSLLGAREPLLDRV